MNPLLTGARKLTVYRWAILVLAVTISLVGGLRSVHSQDPPASEETKEGKTRSTLIVPGNTVDAGEVIFKPDTDHDGMNDEEEAQNGTNPDDPSDADADADGDGLTNGDEVAGGSNVNSADSDGDGVNDGEEVRLGYNPTDANSTPPPGAALASILVTPSSVNISINNLLGQESVALRVTGVRTDGTTFDLTGSPSLTFQSQDENVVLVDGFGNVAGIDAGTTSITITSGSVTAVVPVVVTVITPGQLSETVIPGFANNVDVAGDYAYVAAGSAGLVVLDVSDRRNPVIVATLDTPGNANDVRVVGTTAYVADGDSGLQIIDVSTPGSPALLGSLDTPGDAYDVVVRDTRAYVADGFAGLRIIDVSDPSAPTTLGAIGSPSNSTGVDVSGDLAVVANGRSVQIVDVSIPATPTNVGSVALPIGTNALDLEVRNRFAYVATFGRGLLLIDFSTPTTPQVLASDTSFSLNDIALAGRYAVGAEFVFGNYSPIFDLNDPGSPFFTAPLFLSASLSYRGTGLAVTSQHVYITAAANSGTNNGTTGDTKLFILEYQAAETPVSDTAGIAPVVTIDSPQSGESVIAGDRLPISITATDDIKVKLVQLLVNGVVTIEDDAAPYNITYMAPHGVTSLVIEAKAFDMAGNSATSPPVTINVLPDPPPTITISEPEEGQILYRGQTIFVAADANDNREVAKVVLTINGTPQANFSFYSVPSLPSLRFEATATDDFGQTATTTRIVDVIPDPPPTVTIVSPAEGTQLTEGQLVEFIADASDNIFVTRVEFTINGQVFSDSQAPYRQTYTIPAGTSSLSLDATSFDNLGQSTVTSRVFTVVPDPGTTVTGRVLDTSAQPVVGATAKVGQLTALTGAAGVFSIPDVPTAQTEILVRVNATIAGQSAANASLPTAIISGGTTNVGDITLSIAPTAPTAFALTNFDTDFVPDVFVGYPDRQSLIYSFSGGQFTPNANIVLPYGAVSSGANLDLNFGQQHQIFAQLAGRPGSATTVTFDNGIMFAPTTLATGLTGESEYTAVGLDTASVSSDLASGPPKSVKAGLSTNAVGSDRTVLAFLKNSGGTSLLVRFGNDSPEGFGDPLALPVDQSVPLRSLTVTDINNDGFVDVLVVKPDTGSGSKLVVYLRTSPSTFGSPVESPITVRATAPARGAVDFVLGSLTGDSNKDVAVLGDDRVRIYQGDGTGGFVFVREIIIPAGRIATGLIAADISNDGRSDLIVSTRNTTTPTSKELRVYLNTASGVFLSPTINTYVAPINAGDTRIGTGKWGGTFNRIDAVVVDGETVKIILDVGPASGGGS